MLKEKSLSGQTHWRISWSCDMYQRVFSVSIKACKHLSNTFSTFQVLASICQLSYKHLPPIYKSSAQKCTKQTHPKNCFCMSVQFFAGLPVRQELAESRLGKGDHPLWAPAQHLEAASAITPWQGWLCNLHRRPACASCGHSHVLHRLPVHLSLPGWHCFNS